MGVSEGEVEALCQEVFKSKNTENNNFQDRLSNNATYFIA